MKSIKYFLVLAFLTLAQSSWAFTSAINAVVGSSSNQSSSCATTNYNYTSQNTSLPFSTASDRYYRGFYLPSNTITGTISVCAIGLRLSLGGGSIAGKTFTVSVYTVSADHDANLGTLIATSNGVTGSNSWLNTNVMFSFGSRFNMSNGTIYAIVVTDGEVDATNYA